MGGPYPDGFIQRKKVISMRSKLVFGRYIEINSWIHRLDPRVKLLAMGLYMLVIFQLNTVSEFGLVLVFSILVLKLTNIRYAVYLRALKPLLLIIVFIALFHVLFDASGTKLWSVGAFQLYTGGLERGLQSAGRMILFIAFTALLTFTTSPAQITRGLEFWLRPLRWLGLSPQKFTLMISISLRFIPTVFEEADKILKAQASRGMDIEDLPLTAKAKQLLSLLVPVTVGAVRRALDLAELMEARGYQIDQPRSRYLLLLWQRADTVFLVLFIVLWVAVQSQLLA